MPPDDGSASVTAESAKDSAATHQESGRAADGIDMELHASNVLHWRELSARRNAEARGEVASSAVDLDDDEPTTGRVAKKRPWWVEIPVMLVVAFLLTFLIQTFIARVYYVPSGSMEPTLHGVTHGGDRILAYKLGYDFGEPEQGDVVVFKGPSSWTPEADFAGPTSFLGKIGSALGSVIGIAPPNEKDFVKRVIAVGGQTVSCCDVAGHVQVDGVSLNEPYVLIEPDYPQWEWIRGETSCAIDPDDPTQYESYRCFGPYTVPDGSLWVMGDHRSDSADSTWGCRGLVPSGDVQCQGPISVSDVIGRAVAIVMPPSRWGGIGSPDIMSSPGGGDG